MQLGLEAGLQRGWQWGVGALEAWAPVVDGVGGPGSNGVRLGWGQARYLAPALLPPGGSHKGHTLPLSQDSCVLAQIPKFFCVSSA